MNDADSVKPPLGKTPPEIGLVAILDALGAATYSDEEIARFLDSREQVLEKLNARIKSGKIDRARLKVFTFSDTIVIVYLVASSVALSDVTTFCMRLRAFMMHSLQNRILFRGSLSLGRLYVDDDTNTVMGPAVSDAAAWYDKADWIGIQATPHAAIYIQSLLAGSGRSHDHLIVDYEVPLKGGAGVKTKAINWPKAFYVKGLRPEGQSGARAMLHALLAKHQIPRGTESKYLNAIAFFDFVKSDQKLGMAKSSTTPPTAESS